MELLTSDARGNKLTDGDLLITSFSTDECYGDYSYCIYLCGNVFFEDSNDSNNIRLAVGIKSYHVLKIGDLSESEKLHRNEMLFKISDIQGKSRMAKASAKMAKKLVLDFNLRA